MADEQITTIGRCHMCKRTFGYTPATVMTVMMDPDTNLPLGMTISGALREPSPEAAARAVARHVCPACVDKVKQLKTFMDAQSTPPWGDS
ncbi:MULTISPECIES: hypothetical protein [Nonomuraea]|uniref:hypothetical protein n=1 Tax=Nonomuraea ceibae TaxID=1935170 RepID=UPI001C6049F1|nr:hypothetical protein [Nonomuraea ceibae]